MAKKRSDAHKWKGDAVEARPGDEAELAADRVEGNQPVTAEAEARRLHDQSGELEDVRRAPASDTDPEDDIAEAAEEHRDHQAAQGYPPRGKL